MTDDAPLTDAEIAALHEALDDEHKAVATYEQVLDDFGDVLPFAAIVEAERRHIDALARTFARYGIVVPDNPWTGRTPRFASVLDACAAGAAAEIENAALYDRLMAATDRADILGVFASLRAASQENHLPAFRRCQERGGGRPRTGDERGRAGEGDGSRGGGGGPMRRRRRGGAGKAGGVRP